MKKSALMLTLFVIIALMTHAQTVSGTIDGHDYVDLSLPSGLLWATCNVGASSVEEYGGYYAWGEMEEKDNFSWQNYSFFDEYFVEDPFHYWAVCKDLGENISGTIYDVAHVRWGGGWRLPTEEELWELRRCSSSKWVEINGFTGREYTGFNENRMFLPAAGDVTIGEVSKGRHAFYAGSTEYKKYEYNPHADRNDCAGGIMFDSGGTSIVGIYKFVGASVRPVIDHSYVFSKVQCTEQNNSRIVCPTFDLQGRRIQGEPQKGVYVRGGRKYVRK